MKEAEFARPKMTETELLKLIGDPVEFWRNTEQFERSCDAFAKQYKELLEQYPDKWVAFYEGALRATGTTLKSVIERLEELSIPPGRSLVEFVATQPKTTILCEWV